MNCVGAVWWVFCASSYEMLCFSITLVIGHLPPFDIYCVLIIPALRAIHGGLPCPAESPCRDSQCDFVCVGSGIHSAINGKIRSRDVGGFRTRDKRRHCGDLLNMPIAVERSGGLLRYRPITRSGIQIRVDRTRLDVVDRDAPGPDLSG